MGATEGHAAEVVQPGAVRVRRAHLSVSDKRGLVDFARGLSELGIEIVSTGGTARELSEAGIGTRPIDEYTGFPEILDGRVKTLNPRIYAGLLAVRSNPEHVATLGEQEIDPIDLVCVNLYPFERTAARRGVSPDEVIENIDVGGPTLIRAAAKNNDFAAARRVVDEFEIPAAVIVKHNNPCGCAVGGSALEAFERALATDPVSAFGGVYCFNRSVDQELAEKLHEVFVEVVMAKGYEDGALEILQQKPNVRILHDAERRTEPVMDRDIRRVRGGLLVQDRDEDIELRDEMRVVTERQPTEQEWGELLFGWKVCKHVRSNAIVIAKELGTAGIGAGQMSRVDSVRLAVEKSLVPLTGAALASDAFFPFADGPQLALDAGVTAIMQPGGSRNDEEVIKACNAAGAAMVFAARRHFRH